LPAPADPLSEKQRLAEQGDPRAQYELGDYFAECHAFDLEERFYDDAVQWYDKAAEQGYADARLKRHNMRYLVGATVGDRCSKSLALATVNLGLTGVEDLAKKSPQWRKIADQGLAEAQFMLGNMYACGAGVILDYAEAAGWFRRAAEQGHAKAQYILGHLYFYGTCVARDFGQAARWLAEAHDQGIGPVWMFFEYMHDNGLIGDEGEASSQKPRGTGK